MHFTSGISRFARARSPVNVTMGVIHGMPNYSNVRVYADGNGESHFEDVAIKLSEVDFAPCCLPVSESARKIPLDGDSLPHGTG
ncbi:MAG: hypothetical protein IIA53_10535 [Chloroflexi bacterium]|nr:hypothetical protein [Chloroflexota bacterium]